MFQLPSDVRESHTAKPEPALAGLGYPGHPSHGPQTRAQTEQRLLRRVLQRCGTYIRKASELSSVASEFLAALAANESGGNPHMSRFELSVYRHLKAVAAGESPAYGRIRADDANAPAQENRPSKTEEFHTRFLTQAFGANNGQEIASLADEALRRLATSWGFTQIMGYHLVARKGSVRDLLEPQFHYRVTLELLSQFADDYQLDLGREFEEMFRCWNTGRPYGKTLDPDYVENGMRRMSLYRELVRQKNWGKRLTMMNTWKDRFNLGPEVGNQRRTRTPAFRESTGSKHSEHFKAERIDLLLATSGSGFNRRGDPRRDRRRISGTSCTAPSEGERAGRAGGQPA